MAHEKKYSTNIPAVKTLNETHILKALYAFSSNALKKPEYYWHVPHVIMGESFIGLRPNSEYQNETCCLHDLYQMQYIQDIIV